MNARQGGSRLAAIALALLLLSCSGERARFDASAVDAGVSPGGRWEVTITVTNRGPEAGTPDCTLRAIDADGIPLATDSVTLELLGPGDTATVRVLTGLRPGDNVVRRWRVSCG